MADLPGFNPPVALPLFGNIAPPTTLPGGHTPAEHSNHFWSVAVDEAHDNFPTTTELIEFLIHKVGAEQIVAALFEFAGGPLGFVATKVAEQVAGHAIEPLIPDLDQVAIRAIQGQTFEQQIYRDHVADSSMRWTANLDLSNIIVFTGPRGTVFLTRQELAQLTEQQLVALRGQIGVPGAKVIDAKTVNQIDSRTLWKTIAVINSQKTISDTLAQVRKAAFDELVKREQAHSLIAKLSTDIVKGLPSLSGVAHDP